LLFSDRGKFIQAFEVTLLANFVVFVFCWSD